MPPSKRRRVSGPPSAPKSSQQSTLSFRSTKVSATDATSKSKSVEAGIAKGSRSSDAEDRQNDSVQTGLPSQNLVVDINQSGVSKDRLPEDEESPGAVDKQVQEVEAIANAYTEAKLKSYWRAKENDRKAPRLHQEDLSFKEKILREFDMSSRYGPGIGISRQDRWHRAYNLGMAPPIEVLAVLLKQVRSSDNTQSDTQKSIMDELIMSSRIKGDTIVEG